MAVISEMKTEIVQRKNSLNGVIKKNKSDETAKDQGETRKY